MRMPVLETERLLIRPFTLADLADVHSLLDADLDPTVFGAQALALAERESWLRWTIAGYEENAKLLNPPYGDRAMELKGVGTLVGACGLVPAFGPFALLPSFGVEAGDPRAARNRPEVGLYYALAPGHRGYGYATEAARALIDFAFGMMHTARVVATTTRDNAASIAVMKRLGMRVEENPHRGWLEVAGVIEAETDDAR